MIIDVVHFIKILLLHMHGFKIVGNNVSHLMFVKFVCLCTYSNISVRDTNIMHTFEWPVCM